MPSAKGNFVAEHLHRYAIAIDFATDLEVLDIACGEGYGSALLSKVARRVVGVDCDADAIEHAKKRYTSSNLSFCIGRAERIPLPAGSVDLVVSFETIEHLDDHKAMLQEISRVLKPGGTLLISTPDRDPYRKVSGKTNPFHVHELSRSEFTALLAAYFRYISLGFQKTATGSWFVPEILHPGSEALEFSGKFSKISRTQASDGAPYLLAIASNTAAHPLRPSLFSSATELAQQLARLEHERTIEREQFADLQKQFAERTAWAKSLAHDLETAAAEIQRLQAEHIKAVAWAQSLDADLAKARSDFTDQSKLIEERTAWSQSLERDLAKARAHFDQLTQEHAERTAWAQKLSAELATAAADNQRLQTEHIKAVAWAQAESENLASATKRIETVSAACSQLLTLLPQAVDQGNVTLIQQATRKLAEQYRDLLERKAEINRALGRALEAEDKANSTAWKEIHLNGALSDAQIHVDNLLVQIKDLREQAAATEHERGVTEEKLRQCAQDLSDTKTSLGETQKQLAVYESNLFCRLNVRIFGPK